MKKTVFCALGMACFLLVGAWNLQAQIKMLEVKVPFEFIVQGKTLPAGTYTVKRNEETIPILFMRNSDAKDGVLFSAIQESTGRNVSSESALVFDHVGNLYFLRGITQGPRDSDYQIPKSKRERELIAQGTFSEPVQMAASRR
jgi:hypothetical protein